MGGRPWVTILLCHLALSGVGAQPSPSPGEPPTPGLPPALRQQPNIQRLLERASRQDAKAEDSLGDYCYSAKDYTNAVRWYRRAAEHGDANACISLANCYRHGRGIALDLAAADRWAKRALLQEAPDPPKAPTPFAVAPPNAATPTPAPLLEPESAADLVKNPAPPSASDRLSQERDRLREAWLDALEKPTACSQRVHAMQRPQPELLEISSPARSSQSPPSSPKL